MLIEYKGVQPQKADNVYIAPTAAVIGDVVLGEGVSVWFSAVIRGDSGPIRIGSGVSVQDGVVIHVNKRHDTVVEDNVTIGHAAVLEGCHIGRGTLIGMNATVLDGAVVGENCIIAAGSVVREGANIPDGMLVAGVPAKIKRAIPAALLERIRTAPEEYRRYAKAYMETAVILDES